METDPIFIFGMTARTGTTYLQRLLSLHPNCERFRLPEDFLFVHSDPLIQYAERMKAEYQSWIPHWRVEAHAYPQMNYALRRSLGDGLVEFIKSLSKGKRPVLKTPSVAGFANFLELCPERRTVVIVRDGRSVAESLMRSGLPRQEEKELAWCAEVWNWAAREIARLRENPRFEEQVLIVKFEDLTLETERELSRVLRFFELPLDTFPMEQALNLKLSGSSFVGDPNDRWQEIEKPAGFRPEVRYGEWSESQHAEFNQVAGWGMSALGYECGATSVVRDLSVL